MYLDFAYNIKRLRKEKNVTQEKIAEVFGVSSQSVSRWELGVCYPELELLPAIANYFGVTVDALLLNDSSSKERDLEEFNKKYYTFTSSSSDQIDYTGEYCRKYPENNYYSYMLLLAIRDYLLLNKEKTPHYIQTMNKQAEKLLETTYRMATIQLMATVCPEGELNKWLDMSPYNSAGGRRYCLLARSMAQKDTRNEYIQLGLEKFESLAFALDGRYPDKCGAPRKEAYQLSVMRTIEAFGSGADIPDGWKTFYAYKQLVLSACQFGQKKYEEGWTNFDSAVEKYKYIYGLDVDWLEVGGELFSNIKVDKYWRNAIDSDGNVHEFFGLLNKSFFNLRDIHCFLTNPRWAWFNSVRETEKFREAVEWFDATSEIQENNYYDV